MKLAIGLLLACAAPCAIGLSVSPVRVGLTLHGSSQALLGRSLQCMS